MFCLFCPTRLVQYILLHLIYLFIYLFIDWNILIQDKNKSVKNCFTLRSCWTLPFLTLGIEHLRPHLLEIWGLTSRSTAIIKKNTLKCIHAHSMHTHTHTHTHKYVRTYTHTDMHTLKHIHTQADIYICI